MLTEARVKPYRPNVARAVMVPGVNRNVIVVARLANPSRSSRLVYDTLVPAERTPCATDNRIEKPDNPLSIPVRLMPQLPDMFPRLREEPVLADIELTANVSMPKEKRNGSIANDRLMAPRARGRGDRVRDVLTVARSNRRAEKLADAEAVCKEEDMMKLNPT